ncbi:protein-glutamate O-methyltransferase CheR [Mesobacillus foraminis]|uniref:CheR family methyltransferase n=1 Tax=Mesobacillus foraminis TaxID=279826 RepID=UPI0039A16BBD
MERIEIDLLLEAAARLYGYDFRNYSYSFIQRRVRHCVYKEKLGSISALQEKILRDPAVMDSLLADLSINVTEMFRDPGFFKSIRTKVVPLVKDSPKIRIWHAGCSSGEEVYSMSILLYEEGVFDKAEIFATDINPAMLEKAKRGSFPLEEMQHYTKNYLEAGGKRAFSEYYKAVKDRVFFHPFLSEKVQFSQQDLAKGESFNNFDIILCRNVLIYFNRNLQNEVHKLLYNSLSHSGFLGLGKREGIKFNSYEDCYGEIDASERLYRKIK